MQYEKRFGYYIGATGVHPDENRQVKRVGALFEVPMLMAALWILFSWWAESSKDGVGVIRTHYDLALWVLFVVETALLSWLATNTRRYLRGNWLNMVVIVVGLPVLMGWEIHLGALRILRVLTALTLLFHVGSGVRKMLARNELGTTLAASSVIILMAGVMMAVLDEGIETPLDGIWWAWVTVTSVGYGDVVPLSPTGRAFGSLIILMGLGLTAVITASFAALYISRQEQETLSAEKEIQSDVTKLEARLNRIEDKLDQLLKHRE